MYKKPLDPRTDVITLYVRDNPGCSRMDVLRHATEYTPDRIDAAKAPFYARIKLRERKKKWIKDRGKGNGWPSRLYVTPKYREDLAEAIATQPAPAITPRTFTPPPREEEYDAREYARMNAPDHRQEASS